MSFSVRCKISERVRSDDLVLALAPPNLDHIPYTSSSPSRMRRYASSRFVTLRRQLRVDGHENVKNCVFDRGFCTARRVKETIQMGLLLPCGTRTPRF